MSISVPLKNERNIIAGKSPVGSGAAVVSAVKTVTALVMLFVHWGTLAQPTPDSDDIPSPAKLILRDGADSTRIGDDGTTRLLGKTVLVGAYRMKAISAAIANTPKDVKTKLTCEKMGVDTSLFMSMDYRLRDHGHTRTTVACHLEFNTSQPGSSPITRFVFVEKGERELYMLFVGQRAPDR